MSHPITEGTNLQCDKGTTQTPIQVTSQKFVKINHKLQATEQDKETGANILLFGQCRLKSGSACSPALIKWQQTSPFSIEGKKQLTTDSFCMCSSGGKITPLIPEDTFQNIE